MEMNPDKEMRMRTMNRIPLAVMATLIVALNARAEAPPPIRAPKAVSQPNPSLPAAFKQAHAGETISGAYKICVATDGSVMNVTATESIPDADQSIIDHILKNWRYESTPVKVCVARRFLFKIPPPQPVKTNQLP
jgi:hypothetical protein